MRNRNLQGFTLIELMVTVAIVGILAAIAYPSYKNSVTKSRRAEGKSLLLDAAAREERYFAQYNKYTKVIVGPSGCVGNACGLNYTSDLSANDYYKLSGDITTGYKLTVTAENPQKTDDPSCASFILDYLGAKTATGTDTSACGWP